MQHSSTHPVRQSRRLFTQACQAIDAGEVMRHASDLRSLGRPDLALEILEPLILKTGATREILLEKVLCLKAAGYRGAAMETLALLKKMAPAELAIAVLELKLVLGAGHQAIAAFRFGALPDSVRNLEDLELMLASLPWSKVPLRDLPAILRAVIKIAPARFLLVLLRHLYARLKVQFARGLIGISMALLHVLTGKKEILFSSMGKFTRLADLIDQVDSLIRKLNAEGRSAADRKVFIFFFGGYPNQQIFAMYKKHCTFVPVTHQALRKLALYFIDFLRLADRYTEITVDYRKISPHFLNMPAVIGFSSRESARLEKGLERIGIDPHKPFICMGLRDMAYYQFYGEVMNHPLSKQGKRSETHHRCPPLDSYVRFAQHWAARGHQVIRMGLRVSEPMPQGLDPLIIDYACGDRSDELDAFLFSRCWFLTAGDTGLFSGAAAFDRPAIVSDLFLIRNTIYSSNKQTRNIFVPKLIYDTREARYLSFREQIHFNHSFSYFSDCETAGLKIVPNTPSDIIDASLELVERLTGNNENTPEDDELQAAFHGIYLPAYVGYASTGMISRNFLRKYSYLLD